MKSLLLFTLVLLGPGVAAQSAPNASNRSMEIQNPLTGAWKLVSLEEPGADGQVHRVDCSGMFVFTSDGNAAVQVMYRNALTGSAYTQGGYEASYGTYRISSPSTFTFHIDARSIAHWQRPGTYVPDFGQSLDCEVNRPERALGSRLETLLKAFGDYSNEETKTRKKQF